MSVAVVNEAKIMSDFMINKAFRGPGDTVDAAIHRAGRMWGAPTNWLHRLRYRYRDLRDIPGSALISLAVSYQAASSGIDDLYEKERARHEPNSAIVRLADFVAGKEAARQMK
jgi:hypothetical protein